MYICYEDVMLNYVGRIDGELKIELDQHWKLMLYTEKW